MFVSETYSLLDCLMFDIATTGQKNNDDWHVASGTLETPIPVDDNGAKLNNTGTGSAIYVANKHDTSPSGYDVEFPLDFAVEFDITAIEDTPSIRFYGANNVNSPFTFTTNSIGHWKFEFLSDSIKTYKDGIEVQNWLSSLIGLNLSMAWQFSDTTDGLTFKNFVAYPI